MRVHTHVCVLLLLFVYVLSWSVKDYCFVLFTSLTISVTYMHMCCDLCMLSFYTTGNAYFSVLNCTYELHG